VRAAWTSRYTPTLENKRPQVLLVYFAF